MSVPMKTGYKAYQKNKYETASPHKLILMLYEGALQYLEKAKRDISNNNIADSNKSIQKVQDIIYELITCVDLKQGGEIAKNLRSLYMYMVDLLIQANIKKDIATLEEVSSLLSPIKSAWEQIGKDVALGKAYT